jgi:uncharacterized protein (TIGR03437 family)
VQIPDGSTTAQFEVTGSLIDHDENSTLTASLGTTVQTPLALVGIKPVSISCSPKQAHSGSQVSCQVTLNSLEAAGSITLALASSNSHVAVPTSLNKQALQGVVFFNAPTTYVSQQQAATVTASFHGVTVSDTITLTIPEPVLRLPGRQSTRPGKLTGFSVSASDPTGLPVTISASGLPAHATFDATSGVFTWTPQDSDAGLHGVHFTAKNTANVSSSGDVVVSVGSDTPVVNTLANAASYVDDGGCSPGAVATLLGAGFVKTAPKSADTSPLPTEVNGAQVKLNGDPLPVFYVDENQINFQCPLLAPGQQVTLEIESPTGTSASLSRKMQSATPGIFGLYGNGKGQGAILIANTSHVVMPPTEGIPTQRAIPGDYISIYATGLGEVKTVVATGHPAPLDKLAWAKFPVDVIIGGTKADVAFAGLAPGYIALYQVNAKVPLETTADDAVTVQIIVHLPGGTTVHSNVVTIAVAASFN